MLIVPDEELGSPASRKWIEERSAAVGRVPGDRARPPRWRSRGRPGRCRGDWRLRRGCVGAHHRARGRSAIAALAPLVAKLEALSDRAEGVIVTVGTFTGGTARQVVPDRAEMLVDLRAPTQEAAEALLIDVKALVDVSAGSPSGGITRPAFEPGAVRGACTRSWPRASASVGLGAHEVREQGGSDASFAGATGRPNARRAWPDHPPFVQPRRAGRGAEPGLARRGDDVAARGHRDGQRDVSPQPRSALSSLDPYVAGNPSPPPAAELGLERVVNLATNETTFGPFPTATEAPPASADQAHRYPELDGELTDRIAAAHGVPRPTWHSETVPTPSSATCVRRIWSRAPRSVMGRRHFPPTTWTRSRPARLRW